jgi:hypothetical protein
MISQIQATGCWMLDVFLQFRASTLDTSALSRHV